MQMTIFLGHAPFLKATKRLGCIPAILASALLLAACSSTSPYAGVPPASNAAHPLDRSGGRSAIIQPGDVLVVYVVEDDSLNGHYDVLDGGNIIFPKIGRIQVAGKTSPEIETLIKKLLETNQLRTATVMVERPAQPRTAGATSKTIFISGNVGSPGRHTVGFVGNMRPTVYQAIIDAGGVTRFADQNHILVTRHNPDGHMSRFKVDAQKIRDGSIPDVPIEDGDMIFVPEKAFGW
jgi:polysaccharide export outer membrane protein